MNIDLEENFNQALSLCESELSHEGLLALLGSGNVAERQFAALTIGGLNNQEEVEIFISNLTGCDGKIREAVASRLDEFITPSTFYLFAPYYETFANATIDINANISRLVIDALRFCDDDEFGNNYARILVRFLDEAFEEIAKIKFRDKKYVLNKQLFKMYWSLEGLRYFYQYVEKNVLKSLLAKVLERTEYTIREKAAEILVNFVDDDEFENLVLIVKNDDNFYVRRVIK